MSSIKCYSELIKLPTFIERYRYLKLDGKIGESTFGFERYLNQILYMSDEWKMIRRAIIIRDNGCDLAILGLDIRRYLTIHHINPITIDDIETRNPKIFDPENLICVNGLTTHKAIHYGDENLLPLDPIKRTPGDTCPWA